MKTATALASLALGLALLLPVQSALADVDVNTLGCGASFEGVGFLSADLDCSAAVDGTALRTSIARLELRGFHLIGRDIAFHCGRRCVITGPGALVTLGSVAVSSFGNLRFTDVAISGPQRGIFSDKRVYLNRSAVVAGDQGVVAGFSATIIDSTINDTSDVGVLTAKGPRVIRSEIRGHGHVGIASFRRPVLIDSAVVDNGTDPDCGVGTTCADLLAAVRPRLAGTSSCAHSLVLEGFLYPPASLPTASWGVCTLD